MKIKLISILLLICLTLSVGTSYIMASEAVGTISTGTETGIGGVVKAAPVPTPIPGFYAGSASVTLSAPQSDSIYYTLDGTDVTSTSSSTQYIAAIVLTFTRTIKTKAHYTDGTFGPQGEFLYTITPVPISSGGGGGSSYTPPPTPAVGPLGGINNFDNSVINSLGNFLSDMTAKSEDARAQVAIPTGDIGTTADGKPLNQIIITPKTDMSGFPFGNDVNAIGMAYDFQPSGAKFSQPVKMTLTCKLSDLKPGAVPNQLYIAWFDTKTGAWVKLPSTVTVVGDTVTITALVDHFTVFSVFGPSGVVQPTPTPPVPTTPPATTQPAQPPVPTSTPPAVTTTAAPPAVTTTPAKTTAAPPTPSGPNVWLIVVIVVICAVILLTVLIVIRRKRQIH